MAKLPEVTWQMFAAGLMVRPVQAVFDVADDRVEPLELGDRHAPIAAAGDHGLMLDAGARDATKAGETVGDDDGVGIKVALGEALGLRLAKAFDLAETQPDRVIVIVAGQRGDERGLAR